jgi:hypothetical protein
MSFNLAHGEVNSIQHYVIKFVSYLRQVGGFLRVLRSSTNKIDRHDITEILLKVGLNMKFSANLFETNMVFFFWLGEKLK